MGLNKAMRQSSWIRGSCFHGKHRISLLIERFDIQRSILIVNLILELPSAVFDQLSSVRKPQYALLTMAMSYLVLLISMVDLVHKGIKARVTPWFYYPSPNYNPFGTFLDIIELVCAISQCVLTSIAFHFLSNKEDNATKMNLWPIIFAFGLLFSKFSINPPKRRSTASINASQSSESLTPLIRRLRNLAEFSLAKLTAATLQNQVAKGSFGRVYKGKLPDGREAVTKRHETGQQRDFSLQKDSEFESKLAFFLRLNHMNLVRLVGFWEDRDERLLVYESTKNGCLYDHLNDRKNVQKNSSVINSWKMRIKIALGAANGIGYLHNCRVSPLIHGDIKSSNILLDDDWNARVTGYGLSLMVPKVEGNYSPSNEIGTVGYIDPECFDQNEFTTKSDVFVCGVVLLEILTGKRAKFSDENGGRPTNLPAFAVPKILSGELVKALDPRVGLPELNDREAVELVAYTTLDCVNLEGINRPTMAGVVANLKQSLALCSSTEYENYRHRKKQMSSGRLSENEQS